MAEVFYQQLVSRGGVFPNGRTLIQASGSIGGHRSVFVKLISNAKQGLVYPTFGGKMLNPFKGQAKLYAGDLVEYNPGLEGTGGPTVKVLKTYEAEAAASAVTTLNIVRDGYHHRPFAGDNIMVAPATINGTGTGVTITAVEVTTDNGVDVWKLTLSAAVTAKKGDIFVEASAAGEKVAPMVTNPNAYVPSDMDFVYDPAEDGSLNGARYFFTPCLANSDTYLYINKMSPMPASILALNKSLVKGWFTIY